LVGSELVENFELINLSKQLILRSLVFLQKVGLVDEVDNDEAACDLVLDNHQEPQIVVAVTFIQ
jgi:hypothetical protein